MADRYQFRDTCYDTPLQAAQAQLAAQTPYGTLFDFGDGSGPVAAIITPVRAHDEYAPGEEWHEPGTFEYSVTSQHAGGYFSTTLNVPYYPQPCVADAASDASMVQSFELWGAFIPVIVVVLCARWLYDVFARPRTEA